MAKYEVAVEDSTIHRYTVEAKTEDEANEKALLEFEEGVLTDDTDSDIRVIRTTKL